jgi:hypothetical protein
MRVSDFHEEDDDLKEGYGKYYCSTDKRWKERKGPKQTRKTESKFTDLELAVMEGGHSLDQPVINSALRQVVENFADGKIKGKSRPGRVKRSGASCSGSVTDLRSKAKNASGERAKMYHWCANMKSGRAKNESEILEELEEAWKVWTDQL